MTTAITDIAIANYIATAKFPIQSGSPGKPSDQLTTDNMI